MDFRRYQVSRASKEPLLNFILLSLKRSDCRILSCSGAKEAPFRITFEDASGQRFGIVVYAFFANSKVTRNRPADEHRFQVKYGKKDDLLHEIWQDPFQLYTTLMVGIDLAREVFVSVDPMIHQLTKFFISIEFKRAEVELIQEAGWHSWERSKRQGDDSPVEVMVGCRSDRLFDLVRFEQAAQGLDQGHRSLLAENLSGLRTIGEGVLSKPVRLPSHEKIHQLASEFEMQQDEILNLIQAAPRLKMAVRGWVAEKHLAKLLLETPGITSSNQIEEDGKPDFEVCYQNSPPILIECKNVLRKTMADGTVRVDFQKTRASKGDPCTRFYRENDFQILAACLHPCTENWDFSFKLTNELVPHKSCPGRLSNLVRLDDGWFDEASQALEKCV